MKGKKKPIEFGAIPVHHTKVDKDTAWDAAENEKRLPSPMSVETAKAMYAWMDDSKAEEKD